MRVALVHDWLTGLRGGERVLQELIGLYPGADLYTLVHVPGSTTPEIDAMPITASPLSRVPGIRRHYRWLAPLHPWAIERFDLSGYDLVISCSHAVAKGVPTGDALHVAYCLTPARWLWDQRDAYFGRGPRRRLLEPWLERLRRFDLATSSPAHVTRFVAISSAVAERIQRLYGREAEVVHPPVAVERFGPDDRPPDDFYLLVGGFVPYKRDDLAIEAFGRLGRRLVVAGDGPLRRRLARRAPRNVELRGRVDDAELARLYARCRAVVYPQEEDFGLVAVEAQAAGRPVIALDRGGARDTVRDPDDPPEGGPATGLRFGPQSVEGLMAAVERFETLEDDFDPGAIRSWAEGFSAKHFRAAWHRALEHAQAGTPVA